MRTGFESNLPDAVYSILYYRLYTTPWQWCDLVWVKGLPLGASGASSTRKMKSWTGVGACTPDTLAAVLSPTRSHMCWGFGPHCLECFTPHNIYFGKKKCWDPNHSPSEPSSSTHRKKQDPRADRWRRERPHGPWSMGNNGILAKRASLWDFRSLWEQNRRGTQPSLNLKNSPQVTQNSLPCPTHKELLQTNMNYPDTASVKVKSDLVEMPNMYWKKKSNLSSQ